MNDNKKSSVMIIASIAVLVWIILSFVGMVYFAKHQKVPISIAILGQFFLVIGVFAIISGIKEKSLQPITILFPVVGIGMIAGGVVFQFAGKGVINQMEKILPILVLLIILTIGITVIISTIIRSKKLRQNCTYTTMATCVDMKTRWKEGRHYDCPIYEVSFQNERITLCDDVYTNYNRMHVGDQREVHLNPNNPRQFYEERAEKKNQIFKYIIGGIFTMFALLGIFSQIQ